MFLRSSSGAETPEVNTRSLEDGESHPRPRNAPSDGPFLFPGKWVHLFMEHGPIESACLRHSCPCLATVVGDGEWDTVLDAGRHYSTELVGTVGENMKVMAE